MNSGNYICNISTANLNYEPKQRWLTLGYLCGEQKNLSGLQYHYSINVKNTTECELMQTPQNAEDFYLQCNRFYDYITFPNILGHRSKTEAFAILLPFKSIFENLDQSCYKHLDYILCQAFLPCCPEGTNEDNKTVSHLDFMCEQMCWDAVNACSTLLQPVINFIDCSYYIKTSDINCTYKPVFCNLPPSIQNGHIITDGHNKTVGSTVKYSCDNDYKLVRNNTALCQYSGKWKYDMICKSTKYITHIIIGAESAIVLLLLPIIGIYLYKRHKLRKIRANYFENQPLQKRNREYDAFVSYTYKASIDFVKNSVQPKLELEPNPPFKLLFHTRDFHGATLIIQNILDGIRKSNCAIVLMSQEYIDAPWCREEFQASNQASMAYPEKQYLEINVVLGTFFNKFVLFMPNFYFCSD